jgi:hypothetical protein
MQLHDRIVRHSLALVALLASSTASADIASRVAAGKSAIAATKEARDYHALATGTAMAPVMKTCAPPGSNAAPQDWKLTVVANVSAAGAVQDIEVDPANAVTACVAEQLRKATLPAPPAAVAGSKGFPLQIEMLVTDGSKAKRPGAIRPVFSQIIAHSLPGGFVAAFENGNAVNYIQEFVPNGQTVDNWSQMITLTGAKNMALEPQVTPTAFMTRFASGFKNSCPTTFATKGIGALKVDGHDAFLALLGCGAVQSGTPRSEVTLILAIKGKKEMYSLQWAERAAPLDKAPSLDEEKWKPRFQQLSPLRICDPVSGEAPPYPSCLERPVGK